MSTELTRPDEVEANRMPLIEHLREFRNRLMWALAAVGIGMIIGLISAEAIYNWLTAPFILAIEQTQTEGGLSLVHSPFEGIYTYFRVAFLAGVGFATPMIAYQIWQFIAPGLYKTERIVVLPLTFASTFLFLSGGAFAYYVIFPYAFPFFLEVFEVEASLSINGYLSAVIRMMVAFGVCFQLPVVTWFIARIGLIDHKDMIGAFRYAVVGVFVVAALITPPDVLTQSLLAIPLLFLYVVSIGVAWMATTKKRDEDGKPIASEPTASDE